MLSNSDLIARINSLASNAIGSEESQVSTDRAEALDHYYGRPYGDEKDGRSQVVSRDLSETVDWIMPSLMRVFLQSGNVVEFKPRGPEDVEAAKQESDYVNYIMLEKNDGFLYLHDMFKDALLLKNGYVKAYPETTTTTTVERYSGLSMDEATMLFQGFQSDGAEVEVISQNERIEVAFVEGQEIQIPVIDLELRVICTDTEECIEAIPAEEVRVSKRARGKLNDCDYVEHCTTKTRTELLEMGMDNDFVKNLPAHSADSTDIESTSRDQLEIDTDMSSTSIDTSMDSIEYREVYCRVDYDEDGKAERRRIIIVGEQIPEGDEWNQEIDHYNIYYCTPKRMPHRHLGESLDDELKDIQRIKTVLERSVLDNTYGQVNQEWLINERVNLEDFLVTRPLGVKRIRDKSPIGDCAKPVDKPNILGHVLPVIQHYDQIKANRTGVQPPITGVDPDALKEVREKVASDNLDKANAKVEMIARMLAEIGVKDLAKGVHADLIKYQDKPKMIQLRNKWVKINPQEWKTRTDLRTTVGLGNGNREELKSTLSMIIASQNDAAQFGLVGPMQKYNAHTRLISALGESNPDAYILSPESPEYQQMMQARSQQPPNPLAEVEMIKQQFGQANKQMEIQHKERSDQLEAQYKAFIEQQKNALERRKVELQERAQYLNEREFYLKERMEEGKHSLNTKEADRDYVIELERLEIEKQKVNDERRQIDTAIERGDPIKGSGVSGMQIKIDGIKEITGKLDEISKKSDQNSKASIEYLNSVNKASEAEKIRNKADSIVEQDKIIKAQQKADKEREKKEDERFEKLIAELSKPRNVVRDKDGKMERIE